LEKEGLDGRRKKVILGVPAGKGRGLASGFCIQLRGRAYTSGKSTERGKKTMIIKRKGKGQREGEDQTK